MSQKCAYGEFEQMSVRVVCAVSVDFKSRASPEARMLFITFVIPTLHRDDVCRPSPNLPHDRPLRQSRTGQGTSCRHNRKTRATLLGILTGRSQQPRFTRWPCVMRCDDEPRVIGAVRSLFGDPLRLGKACTATSFGNVFADPASSSCPNVHPAST